jgi:hypothetical protein
MKIKAAQEIVDMATEIWGDSEEVATKDWGKWELDKNGFPSTTYKGYLLTLVDDVDLGEGVWQIGDTWQCEKSLGDAKDWIDYQEHLKKQVRIHKGLERDPDIDYYDTEVMSDEDFLTKLKSMADDEPTWEQGDEDECQPQA